jgi:excinuclease ABC subunit C
MNKSEYRRFKIKFHQGKPDDFAMIREVLTRRLNEGKAGNPKFSRMPDLIIVDGGKGQLASALAAMDSTGVHLPVCGLAKRFELLIVPNEPDPVALPRTSQALYLVQRIRDEAHRFANAYRVTLQSKKQTQSLLDDIPGIGPARRKALLKHFGSIDGIRSASLEQIAAAPTMNRVSAETVFNYLKPDSTEVMAEA